MVSYNLLKMCKKTIFERIFPRHQVFMTLLLYDIKISMCPIILP